MMWTIGLAAALFAAPIANAAAKDPPLSYISCQAGAICEVVLRPGEQPEHLALTGPPADWPFDSETDRDGFTHIRFYPKRGEMHTELTIQTIQRTFRFDLRSETKTKEENR